MNGPVRIIQVFGRLNRGGAESVIMNLYRNIDRDKVQFDFIVHTEQKCDYDDEILLMGGKIYSVPQFKGLNFFDYCHKWNLFFKTHPEYKIIHSHISSTAAIFLLIAKFYRLFTISHSHNISSGKGYNAVVKDVMQLPLRYICNYYMACSLEAGIWLYGDNIVKGDKFKILKNALSLKEFFFDEEKRNLIRNQLNIRDNQKVLIHVGRFHYQKNHEFLIDLFALTVKENSDFLLILVGDGELKLKIMEKVNELKIQDNVIFLGVRQDIPDLLIAADIFVFPSHFEGLGVVLIEAQVSGLPCLISDKIPNEAIVSNLIYTQTLKSSAAEWTKNIKKISLNHKERKTEITEKMLNYDIQLTSKWLIDFYTSILNERDKDE